MRPGLALAWMTGRPLSPPVLFQLVIGRRYATERRAGWWFRASTIAKLPAVTPPNSENINIFIEYLQSRSREAGVDDSRTARLAGILGEGKNRSPSVPTPSRRMTIAWPQPAGERSQYQRLMRATVPSIQSSTSRMISFALLDLLEIGGPMTTRMVPGRFRKLRRGQKCPAL